MRRPGAPVRESRERKRPGKCREFRSPYILGALVLGGLSGFWAAEVRQLIKDVLVIAVGMATGDLALLAVVITAVALMSSFLKGNYGRVISDAAGLNVFFFPFRVVACVSATAALTSFLAAMDYQDAFFGLAVMLTVWTIFGAVVLVFTFIQYATDERRRADEELVSGRPSV